MKAEKSRVELMAAGGSDCRDRAGVEGRGQEDKQTEHKHTSKTVTWLHIHKYKNINMIPPKNHI